MLWGFKESDTLSDLKKKKERKKMQEILLEVHWLGLHALSAEGLGLISDWGTEIPQAERCDQKKKKKKTASHENLANKRNGRDFK